MIIIFHPSFKKRYKKVSLKIRSKFDERLFLFEEDLYHPQLNNHPLGGDREGQWSINITGDLRAVYVFKGRDIIIFIDIDTHSNLYK